MNFGNKNIKNELSKNRDSGNKRWVKGVTTAFKVLVIVLICGVIIGASFVFGAVTGAIDATPTLTASDIAPKGLSSVIYDTNGNEIQTLTGSGANRTIIERSDIPDDLINAFVAIEDARFWSHEGVDVKGIVRAAFVGISSGLNFTEGASTITQQLIKNNVFNGGSERTVGARFVRKIQEQSLALELEETVNKDTIITNYLNTINLGSNCLGIEKAANRYFDKTTSELTLSESAVIAGITQNPYAYNPIEFPKKNAARRLIVLENMVEQGYITEAEKNEALEDDVYERIAAVNAKHKENVEVYSYFVDRLTSDILRDLKAAGYSETKAKSLLYSGGLKIYSTQDSSIQKVIDEEVNKPSNYSELTSIYSYTYSLRVIHSDDSFTDYNTNDVNIFSGKTFSNYSSKDAIYSLIESFKSKHVSSSDDIIESLDITIQPQASIVVMDQLTGQVKALVGGRGDKTASLSLNRATNTCRQPGSTFKVLAAFAPALERKGATLATTYVDEPFTYTTENGAVWSPKNWWGSGTYAGASTIRQGIAYSMNIVAAKCLVDTVGVDTAYEMVEKFGINTLIPENEENKLTGLNDRNPNIALGGITQGVTNLQLTGAYASIANNGMYTQPILYTKIEDSNGKVILNNNPEKHYVLSPANAYLLTMAMSNSLENETFHGINTTSSVSKLERLPGAAKSGTTDNYNDAWFVGFSPYYTIGIWSGYDNNTKFSSSVSFHKVMWKTIMDKITANLPYKEFVKPANISEVHICKDTGLVAGSTCNSFTEYFVMGTEPKETCSKSHVRYEICDKSGLLASPDCESTHFIYGGEVPTLICQECPAEKKKKEEGGGTDPLNPTTSPIVPTQPVLKPGQQR